MSSSQSKEVLVVGAGISGLLAARRLAHRGANVRIFEKSRGLGGRLATRRGAAGVFDHGAQFFTARDPQFQALGREWEKAGVVKPWADGFALSGGGLKQDGETRFCGTRGMTSLAKHLAEGLDLRLNTRVTGLESSAGGWQLTVEGGATFRGDAVLLTAPVPQSLALLSQGGVRLHAAVQDRLERISYAPCLALLIQLAGPSRIPTPGGVWFPGEPVAWMADNRLKGISEGRASAVTLHAGPDFSRRFWDAPEKEVTAQLLEVAEPWLGGAPVQTQLHRWRYSLPIVTDTERCLVLREPAVLALAGDAFGGPRVEGAALSGLTAGETLAQHLDLPGGP